MDIEDIIQAIIEYFNINTYNWQGCYIDGRWFSPAEVVYCIEEIIDRYC